MGDLADCAIHAGRTRVVGALRMDPEEHGPHATGRTSKLIRMCRVYGIVDGQTIHRKMVVHPSGAVAIHLHRPKSVTFPEAKRPASQSYRTRKTPLSSVKTSMKTCL